MIKIIILSLLSSLDSSDADIAISAIASEFSASGDIDPIREIISILRDEDMNSLADSLEDQLI